MRGLQALHLRTVEDDVVLSLLSRCQVISSRRRLLDLLCLLQHYKVQGFSLEPDER